MFIKSFTVQYVKVYGRHNSHSSIDSHRGTVHLTPNKGAHHPHGMCTSDMLPTSSTHSKQHVVHWLRQRHISWGELAVMKSSGGRQLWRSKLCIQTDRMQSKGKDKRVSLAGAFVSIGIILEPAAMAQNKLVNHTCSISDTYETPVQILFGKDCCHSSCSLPLCKRKPSIFSPCITVSLMQDEFRLFVTFLYSGKAISLI